MTVADPQETAAVISGFVGHAQVGADVRQSVDWTADVLADSVSVERAKLAFDTFVDPAEIDRVFALWRHALR